MLWRILALDWANAILIADWEVMKSMCFLFIPALTPVVFVFDRIWPLKHFREFFDLFWSIKLYIAANDRLIKDLVSQVWSNCRISCLDPKQHSTNSCFVRDLIVTLGQSRLQISFVLHNSSWLGNQMVPNKLTKVGGIQTHKKCGKRDFPSHLAWRLRHQKRSPGTRIQPAAQA